MSKDNFISIAGNVTRDPELRFTDSGTAVAAFSVALNERKLVDGNWEDGDPTFVDVTAWQQLAENVAETVTKGTRVLVTGRIKQDNWETKEGDKRSKLKVIADDVTPSLRWATATVTRNERKTADSPFTGEEPF